ncbi:UDP-N-acetylglucosamine transferase subunit [Phytophthora cinnamomi]|uniref:UDP-N-acetylglucosamine transferase subunit n=1 Tax=Phytophthora cinnamomi TaxID=4785 RepID=UPI00355A9318|nr:UDP-N-acetylglucosamine transferase subunit [Phytophthora cinnamomi]
MYSSADAEVRADELMQAFRDPEVAAIVCTIGGFTSHEILECLDFDVIAGHLKIFCGFSDITTLHLALYAKTELCSFYGPAAIVQFGEFPVPLSYTMDSFLKIVSSPSESTGEVAPSEQWTDDKTANWLTGADVSYQEVMKVNSGYQWVRPGRATGRILGGCLPTLLQVRGTEYMPDLQDVILLIETPEGAQFDQGMALQDVNVALGWLRADGTFGKIKGLVVGRAFAYSEAQVAELKRLIRHHTRGTSFPILYGVDVGHTNPIATIPLGCQASLDSSANSFRILESGVVD